MWLLAPILAADGAIPSWQVVLVAAIPALAAIGAAAAAMKGTFRQSDTTREVEFDKAVDADRKSLREERDHLRTALEVAVADRDRYREMHAQLRVAVREHGLDPDKLGGT